MKKAAVLGICIMFFTVNGCISVHDVYVPSKNASTTPESFSDELGAVKKISSPEAKIAAFESLSRRPGISGAERSALIDAINDSGLAAAEKDKLLLNVIETHSGDHEKVKTSKPKTCAP